MAIRGILFDKDGTLLNFNGTWLEPYMQAANYLAHQAADASLAETLLAAGGYVAHSRSWQPDSLLASASNEQILRFWADLIGRRLEDSEIDQVQKIFSRAGANDVPAAANLPELLQCLKTDGYKLGLATMDDYRNAEKMVSRLALQGQFDFICGADSGYGIKPDPGMIGAFAEHCDLVCGEVCMVGDSPKDLQMGRNAHCGLCVGVLTGAHQADALASLADYVLTSIKELPALLRSL